MMLNFKKNYNFLSRSKACPFRTIVSGTIASRTIVSRGLWDSWNSCFIRVLVCLCVRVCVFVRVCACSCVCVWGTWWGNHDNFSYHLNQITLARPSRSWTSCFGTWPCEDDRISAKLLTQFVSGDKKEEKNLLQPGKSRSELYSKSCDDTTDTGMGEKRQSLIIHTWLAIVRVTYPMNPTDRQSGDGAGG